MSARSLCELQGLGVGVLQDLPAGGAVYEGGGRDAIEVFHALHGPIPVFKEISRMIFDQIELSFVEFGLGFGLS